MYRTRHMCQCLQLRIAVLWVWQLWPDVSAPAKAQPNGLASSWHDC